MSAPLVLPAVERPPGVEAAVTLLEERKADVAAAEQAVRDAQASLREAKALDLDARARARDRGEHDPGRRHEEAATGALEDADGNLEVERLRFQRAESAYDTELRSGLPAWRAAVEKALVAAEEKSRRAIAQLEAAEQRRGELRAAALWIAAVEERRPARKVRALLAESPLKKNASGDRWSVGELIEGLRGAVEDTSVDAERRAVEEREQREQDAERVAEQRRAFTESAL